MSRKNREVVFLRNGLLSGGLSIMSATQANFFYELGFDVTILIDQAYSDELFNSNNARMYDKRVKIVPGLTSEKYLTKAPEVNRKARRREWFGGSISEYYDEYGELVKKTYHDSDNQRIKIEIPIIERYLSKLKKGDIVIAMEVSIGWYLGYLKLPQGVLKIYQHHNQHFFLSPWIDNSENFDAVIVQTKKTKEFYEKLYGKKNNFLIIGNPLRVDIPENITSHNQRKLKIVVVGNLSEGKQPIDAIEAFDIISKKIPDSYLEFYGSGNLRDKISSLIEDKKLQNRVFLKGYEKNLSKIFSDASLMLFPTKRESFGLVILEAFAFGVPVVAYSTKFGVDDLIDNGKDGYIVKQSDINELANRAIELLKDSQKREVFAKAGRDKIKEYEYEKIMGRWKKLLIELSNTSEKRLFNNWLKREEIPKKLRKFLLKYADESSEIKDILKKDAKVKIIEGKVYLFSKILKERYKIPLDYFALDYEE